MKTICRRWLVNGRRSGIVSYEKKVGRLIHVLDTYLSENLAHGKLSRWYNHDNWTVGHCRELRDRRISSMMARTFRRNLCAKRVQRMGVAQRLLNRSPPLNMAGKQHCIITQRLKFNHSSSSPEDLTLRSGFESRRYGHSPSPKFLTFMMPSPSPKYLNASDLKGNRAIELHTFIVSINAIIYSVHF